MSLIRVMEVVGQSQESFEDAIKQAVGRAEQVVENVTGVEVLNFTADIRDGDIVDYKANVHIAYKQEV